MFADNLRSRAYRSASEVAASKSPWNTTTMWRPEATRDLKMVHNRDLFRDRVYKGPSRITFTLV
uniref:Uncharacterized protein n=1 Tax=Megaselia scalaris TaxID=36166 RepID=T1GW92_MEGSC